eukprot:TRINITY_DN7001_c0_g2_i1.p1 TRINITY_DN7001_c0_g2~~TRINITY_DN7001_c0_g2_i1.p1  ORF type:complete len:464 (-),score=102.69 TRINITY_DN7001_c0_g2_i1:892-2079(-)
MEGTVNAYCWVDPDSDISLPRELSEDELEERAKDFIDKKIQPVLDDSGFMEVPFEEVEEAQLSKNANGIEITPPPADQIYYRMFQRGRVKVEKSVRSWRTWFRKKTFRETEYKRLLVIFSLADGAATEMKLDPEHETKGVQIVLSTEEVKKDDSQVELIDHPWWQFWHWFGPPKQIKIKGIKPDMVYMKMFKDMQVGDIDQLVPGSRVKFSLLDNLMIWVPVVFGFGAAVYKAARGNLTFEWLVPLLTTLLLVLFPLYYGYRAYAAIQLKGQQLRAKLNELFLLHNLTNNSGVLSYLIEEAEEQEDKENMLAYFFLWLQGQKGMSKDELDKTIEDFLIGIMKKFGIVMRFDFDVADAISDITKCGLAREISADTFVAVDMATAVEKVAAKNYPQK